MGKYIDAEKLIAKIRQLRSNYEIAKSEILDIIASLQQDHIVDVSKMVESEHIADVSKMIEQPELDLEKKYQDFCKDFPFPWEYVNREYIDELCLSVARHFYELGRNARKEE